ncbi:hypothetical protein GCM10007079_30450 [Nocardiopsis terrae]|uniref:Elongation factor G, domain IV n=1 Tax=Nocardiopsis terrae TaxID=372655 RepID=A0ABR9HIQ0_9ACTN|nr:hypothetical protein [Nocardiopsis terrae]MBE1458873.1 hypothetical protein [Nocardiopsis terrae]GHC86845.1 hypothetical protein GCM10007079_30450 [Nocardiopsis terrae]
MTPDPPGRDPLPPLPRPVTGVHVRNFLRTACPGYFALVWLDAGPALDGADFEFVDDLPATCPHPDEPLPEVFRAAFAKGVREGLENRGRAPYATRVVLRDAVWSGNDSNPQSFEITGRYAAEEILECVRQGREPRRAGRNALVDRPVPPMPRTLPRD